MNNPKTLIKIFLHQVKVLLNHPENDPYNKPTVIKVMLVPEMSADRTMELEYRYAVEVNGELEYKTRMIKLNRSQFPIPTKENDFRFGIFPGTFQRWNDCVATLKKADKYAFNRIKYEWETPVPLFDGMDWNQFQKDFIRSRYSAKESIIMKSYK